MEELMMKSYKFSELMKLMPYANEAAHMRPNQLKLNVEKRTGARDGIRRVSDNPKLASGVYYVGLNFEDQRWEYIGESSVSIFSRIASHCLKLLYRTPNPSFRKCLVEKNGPLTQAEIREMFEKIKFKTQYHVSSFIMGGTSVMGDKMLSLGQRIARRYPTLAEQKVFSRTIDIKIWESKNFMSQELTRASTRLVETYFLRKYFSEMGRLPLLNVDNDQEDHIAKRRLNEFVKLYTASSLENDSNIDSVLQTIKNTLA
tara:strand:- start:725 stop:1498 length:774 start_codon:yes stop_codon:yes gene_type:complete